ncbi:MAG TPA: type I-U CRISPR-associated RAMP protein Csb1/Cas7u [Rubrivivax sp.]|nr:type I-U CRISPR-associated RAMP protein Csb1/Cas7u [Rubrivivax sp.]
MTLDLSMLDNAPRLLFAIPLVPLQGQRFQPTGFPGLGAATFRSAAGDSLLVESAQSMANRLERTFWNEANNDVIEAAKGISHVRVTRKDGTFLTDTILEAHRLNSPYLLKGSNKDFFNRLESELALRPGPIDRRTLVAALLKLDVGSLLHGVFISNDKLAGGRLRLARALSAFIEADGVRVAASGGVKNDHVNPSGETKSGFGNVPFARDEFTADRITLYVNLDLSQIRGYGLDAKANKLLIVMALFKLRALLDGSLRLRTACDLMPQSDQVIATAPAGFKLPAAVDLKDELRQAVTDCAQWMEVNEATYGDEIKGKADGDNKPDGDDEAQTSSD